LEVTILKKLFFAIILLILSSCRSVFASEYDKALSNQIKELGIFDGSAGIAYASIEHFSESSDVLFIAHIAENEIICEIYSDLDGLHQTDLIKFPCADFNSVRVSLAHQNNKSFLTVKTVQGNSQNTDFFTVTDDRFQQISPVVYNSIAHAVSYENQRFTVYSDSREIYNFLKSLKLSKINSSKLTNRVSVISSSERENILSLLAACADVMNFDKKSYDYDRLMKYILATHKNFAELIGFGSNSSSAENALGVDNISMVSSDYIDCILTSVFGITPEHPPVNALVDKGYCYSNGIYYYKNIFNTYFYTDILDLTAVYELGGGVYYVIFSDIYFENNITIPEYSFAIIRKSAALPYSLIRIGMGENLLDENEILEYSPQQAFQNPNWITPSPDFVKSDAPITSLILIIVIILGSVMLIIGVIFIIKVLSRK
jgi:hypothetical protein